MKTTMVMVTMMILGFGCAGPAGHNGINGTGCTASQATNGAVVICGDGSEGAVTDGVGLVSTSISAPTAACANGGYEVIISRDFENTKIWNSDDIFQTMFTVCNGTNGTAGTDAVIQPPVQLCPNNGTTTYASTFNEVAFCFNDKLYGVYSANDGFMSELPPGAYTSNGIGSSCTFTIGTNCSVVQN